MRLKHCIKSLQRGQILICSTYSWVLNSSVHKNTCVNAVVKTQSRDGCTRGLGWLGAVLVWCVHVGFHFTGFHRDEHRGDSQHHGELLHHSHSGAPEPAHLHPVLQPQGAEDRQLSKPSSQFVLCIVIPGRGDTQPDLCCWLEIHRL